VVDEIFHIGGLKDLQALCKCRADQTGNGLLDFGIPPAKSEEGSPQSGVALQPGGFVRGRLDQQEHNGVHGQVASILLDLEYSRRWQPLSRQDLNFPSIPYVQVFLSQS
jgi:hypothetical protein